MSSPRPDLAQSPQNARFHAIVIGAGVSGLLASHMLSAAGISHVVLERSQVSDPALGASIAMYPHGARILQQLEILDAVNAVSSPITEGATDRWPDGSAYGHSDLWRFIRENHGHDLVFAERRTFLCVLYDTLPDKSRIQFSSTISSIDETPDAIEVRLANGTCHRGDILIGCDGVHSLARSSMWARAASPKYDPKLTLMPRPVPGTDKTSIQAHWQCLLGYGPGVPGMKHEISVVHDNGYSLMLIPTPGQVFFYAFVKNRKPYPIGTGKKYTREDAEEMASRYEDRIIGEKILSGKNGAITFGELWRQKFRGQLVDTEQGMLERWHFGRTVLVGDAVHKMTPNMALGANSALESLAVLTNHLHSLLQTNPNPSLPAIESTFSAYQAERVPRMHKILRAADDFTRIHGWDSAVLKFLSLYVFPYLPERTLANEIGKLVVGAPKLDFVAWEGFAEKGRMKWKDESASATKSGSDDGQGSKTAMTAVRMGSVSFLVLLVGVLLAFGADT